MSKKTDIMAALTPYVESVTKDLTIGETIIPIKIKPLITPKMRATIVNEVGQHIDDGDGRNFGLVDWAFRSAVVKICTDLHISLDGGFEAALLYKTDIYTLIADVIGEDKLAELEEACYKQINAAIDTELVLMQAMTQSNPFDRIADAATDLMSGLKNVITGIDVDTAKALLSGTLDGSAADNLVYGLFGKEGEDGTPDTDEQTDLSGADEADKSGEHSVDE